MTSDSRGILSCLFYRLCLCYCCVLASASISPLPSFSRVPVSVFLTSGADGTVRRRKSATARGQSIWRSGAKAGGGRQQAVQAARGEEMPGQQKMRRMQKVQRFMVYVQRLWEKGASIEARRILRLCEGRGPAVPGCGQPLPAMLFLAPSVTETARPSKSFTPP